MEEIKEELDAWQRYCKQMGIKPLDLEEEEIPKQEKSDKINLNPLELE